MDKERKQTNLNFCHRTIASETTSSGIHKILILLLFSVLNFFPLFSQDNLIGFSHIDVNMGLSDNWIKCIYKDSKGFIWFGTSTGLNRFDGYKFEVFKKNNSDSSSIADNSINVITEDKEGNLWVGTRGGISVLDANTYKFRRVNLSSSPALQCQDIAYITAIDTDPEGNILIGTHNGLFFFNNKNKSFRHILINEQSCDSESNNITSITHDNLGCSWIGTINGFIVKFTHDSNSFERFESYNDDSNSRGQISEIFSDRENNIWVGDINGLFLYNSSEKSWNTVFNKKAGPFFRKLQISGIGQDIDNQIWVTTDGNGAFIIDPVDFSVFNIKSYPYADGSLSSNGITALHCDNSGIIWLGTSKEGADFYRKNISKFRLYRNYPTDGTSLSNNDVNCVTEDYKGNLWIGTNGGGLNYLDRKTNRFTRYMSQPGKANAISSNIIVSLFEDSDRKLWIGTYLGGLNCFDPASGKFITYKFKESDSTTISDDRIWDICEDKHGNLWIATLTNGLNCLDKKSGEFKRYNTQNSSICFNYLNSIEVDENDNLWISSANGLIFFNPHNNSSKCYYNNPATKTSLSDNQVISTFKDSRGLFWVCTSNGLNLMNQETGGFRVFSESDGLPSNSVLRVLEDKNSNLWISTKNGISKMIVSHIESGDGFDFKFVNYGLSNGLQGKEFTETCAFSTREGELWFGGTEGLNGFYPSDIVEDNSETKLVFTDFRLFNIKIKYGEKVNNRILLEKPFFNTEKVVLKYKENSFTIGFAALNYFFPEKTKYSYNLEGFNDIWINTEGIENFATFSNLNNGTYTFRITATNSDGIWNKKPIELEIKVLPPFWKSWYAYVIYVLFLMSLLAILRAVILYRERLKIQIEQEQIENQHVHEIDSLKIKFLTNISHEFRTPLTLILSPVEKLIHVWKGKPEEKHLRVIQQNARRLLLMVNQLLDFRRLEVQGFGFNPSYGDIVSFIHDIVNSFNDLSEQKKINLFFNSDIRSLNTLFDKDKLEKIIFNLLSNAFKFTPVNGTITVSITKKINPASKILVRVQDSGIGIPDDKIDKLFTDFYQVDSQYDEEGTGLGLALVKEFVKLHSGEINVESKLGIGSCFTIVLPVVTSENEGDMDKIQADGGDSVFSLQQKHIVEDTQVKRQTIVLVEDNDDLRFYIKDNLQDKYEVFEASNGDEAYPIILKTIPDLIISDVVMAGMDGKELCRKVKSNKRLCNIPFIIITAHSAEKEQIDTLATGADDFIAKPFNFQILEAKVSNFINLRSSLKHSITNNLKIEPADINVVSLDDQLLEKALALVEKNISKVDYTVEELSNDLGVSRTLLYKKILTLTGKPPLEFIRIIRLKRAAQLLQKSQFTVSEIAFKVGFNDPKYFRKHFKNEFGVLPSKYAEKAGS